MKKKKSGGGGANWMDTYGDMVTLLLCFFVLLYSMSTISEEKWKAIVTSFNPFAQETPTDPDGNGGPIADPILGETGVNEPDSDKITQESIEDMMQELFERIQNYASSEGLESTVAVSMEGGEILVKLSDKAMFAGDSYRLLPAAQEVLTDVCGMLDSAEDAIEKIEVEGHTAQLDDNRPNETYGDRHLASDRAAEVASFIQNHSSVHPARICAVSWGQWHAIADNQGEDGKAPNRRVELLITGRNLEEELDGKSLSRYTTDEQPAQTQEPAVSTQEP